MRSIFLRLLRFLRILPYPKVEPLPTPVEPPVVTPTPIPPKNPKPSDKAEGAVPKVVVTKIVAFNPEIEQIKAGVELLNKVLASQLFKDKVSKAKFTEVDGKTGKEVYADIAKTVEVEVRVFTGTYMQNYVWKTIGYEDVPGVVNVNRFFVASAKEFADNIIHEAVGHSNGYSHYGTHWSSMPYQLNEIFYACCEELGL